MNEKINQESTAMKMHKEARQPGLWSASKEKRSEYMGKNYVYRNIIEDINKQYHNPSNGGIWKWQYIASIETANKTVLHGFSDLLRGHIGQVSTIKRALPFS